MKLRQLLIMLLTLTSLCSVQTVAQAQFQQVQIKGPKDSNEQYSGVIYGPIDSSDTLWRIAERYRQNKNLSVYQVMVAIYELNPTAFEDNNLNHLLDGAILKLPSERYIARIDSEQAKLKSEQDDSSWVPAGTGPGSSLTNLKPPEKLASKTDLSDAQAELENKLTAMNADQGRQLDEIRQQVAASIESVELLIVENQKVFDRLDSVNSDIDNLRQQVEGDVQQQIDEQTKLQREILDLIRMAEAREEEQAKSSFASMLKDPMVLIGGSVLLTFGLLVLFARWLMNKRDAQPEPEMAAAAAEMPVQQPAAPMDDLSDSLTDELSGELDMGDDSLFNDDDLLDDVLADELEESFDEALDNELEDFDDLSDEMLVPQKTEQPKEQQQEQGSAELDQDELDSLFEGDEDLLSELDDIDGALDNIEVGDEADAIDLSDQAAPISEDPVLDEVYDQDDIEQLLEQTANAELAEQAARTETAAGEEQEDEQPAEADIEPVKPAIDEDEEKPEISIDELFDQPEQPELPDTIKAEDSGAVSEEMLQQLDDEIEQQNQKLDNITDNLLNEIEQIEMMREMMPEGDLLAEEEPAAEQQHDIQQLDDLSDDLQDDLADDLADDLTGHPSPDLDVDLSDEFAEDSFPEQDSPAADMVTDEVLEDLQGVEKEPEETEPENQNSAEQQAQEIAEQAVAADILAELQASQPEAFAAADSETEAPEQETESLDLTDELLAELEQDMPDAAPEFEAAEVVDSQDSENVEDSQNTLADELLAEMEAELPQDDDAEPQVEAESAAEPDESQNDLADELLAELEAELPPADEQEEFGEAEQSQDQQNELADELLAELEAETAEPEVEEQDADFADIADSLLEQEAQDDGADDLVIDELAAEQQSEAGTESSLDEQLEQQQPMEPDELDDALAEFELEQSEPDEFGQSAPEPESTEFDDAELERALDEMQDQESAIQDDTPQEEGTDAEHNIDELEDVPGLEDWLAEPQGESDEHILDELEHSDFDQLLDEIEQPEDQAVLDNPDLDLEALLQEENELLPEPEIEPDNEAEQEQTSAQEQQENFLDVEQLLNESLEAESNPVEEKDLDLDVSLQEFTGVTDDTDLIDVDSDQGVGAKMDLARAYIEIGDNDAARDLLQEVIDEGDETQQSEAKQVLEDLS